MTEALSNTKKADARLISFSNAAAKRKNVFDKWNDTLATKLQNLKDKIAEARNTADGVITLTLSYFLNVLMSNNIYRIRIYRINIRIKYPPLDSRFLEIGRRKRM